VAGIWVSDRQLLKDNPVESAALPRRKTSIRNEVTPTPCSRPWAGAGANRMCGRGGIPQEAKAGGNASDMLTWGRSPEGDRTSSGQYALSASLWLSVVDATSVQAVKAQISQLQRWSVRHRDRVTEEPDEANVSCPVLKQRRGRRLPRRLHLNP
jgi:hypothetical protein